MRCAADHPFWLRPDAPRAAVAALEPLRREMVELKAQIEQAMEASAAALRDAERARQESAQRRAQVSWAGGRIAQREGVWVASKLGIPAPLKPPPPAPAAAPPPASVAMPKPLGSSAVDGGVMQRLAATEAVLEVRNNEVAQLRKELAAAQRALEAQATLASGGARRSRSGGDLAGAAAVADGQAAGGELARERQRADTAERAARAAVEAVRRLTDQLEEKQAELDEALAAANPEACDDAEEAEDADVDAPHANGDGDAHAAAVRSAAVALRGALVAERDKCKALEAELAAAKRAAAAAEERAASATAAAAAAAASGSPMKANGGSRGSRSGPGAFSGEDYDGGDDGAATKPAAELHSPSLAMPMEPRGRRGSAAGRSGDAEKRAAQAEAAAEAAAAQVTRLKDALTEEKRAADALRAQLLDRAGEPVERGRAPPDDALARKRAKDAEAALAAERERRAAAEARARAAADEAERLTEQLAAARARAADATSATGSSGDAERIAQLERTLHREREAATRALAEARAAAASASPASAASLPAGLDADEIGPARALMMERKRSAQLAAQLEDVTARLARSATGGGSSAPSPASPAASAPGVAAELARLQARCRSLQEALDASQARGCELEQDLAEALRVGRTGARVVSSTPSPAPSPLPSPLPSRMASPVPHPAEDY